MSVESVITENLDIWTSAIKTKSASGRGSSNKLELYGVKKLRELILELAVRGKLVPQDSTDEPATVLLSEISDLKASLILEKKIRKPKALPQIVIDSIPYEIPKSWEWCYLSDLGSIIGGGTPKSGEPTYWAENDVKWLTPADLYGLKEKYISQGKRDISTLGLEKSSAQLLPKGSVLFSSRAPIGYVAIAANELATNQGFKSISPFKTEVSEYIYYFLKRSGRYIDEEASGTTFKEVSGTIVGKVLVPLPPLNEQKKIVSRVDELMLLCDQLESQTESSIEAHKTLVETLLATLTNAKDPDELNESWQRISEHFDTLFNTEDSIDQLKQTILQLAVMGKLVKQDLNDEPASALLERIAQEKEQLIKDKKIKKQKALLPISEDEMPFELPVGWEWSRIGNASLRTDYGLSDKSSENIDGIPVLAMGQIQEGKVKLDVRKMVPSNVESLPELYLESRDLLYNRTNSAELVGKTGIYEGTDSSYTFASYLIRIRTLKDSLLPEFLNLNMQTPIFRKTQIVPHLKQQCGQANVNGTIMKSMIVAIAPEAEMRRIDHKLNQLINLCDNLKLKLQEAKLTQSYLADSISLSLLR